MSDDKKPTTFEDLRGRTLVTVEGCETGSEDVSFVCADGWVCRTYHHQDCCEDVRVEEVIGDVADLVGEVMLAEEVSDADGPDPLHADSWTWTFYKIATVKGHVTIRWLGESNGYYGEEALLSWSRRADHE